MADTETELAELRTELSAQRTRDALDRTLMAWIRTALSMISFGFGLFKILQYMVGHGSGKDLAPAGSNAITLSLIGLGTVLLLLAMVQHQHAKKELRRTHPVQGRLPLGLVAAAGIVLVGCFALAHLVHDIMS